MNIQFNVIYNKYITITKLVINITIKNKNR